MPGLSRFKKYTLVGVGSLGTWIGYRIYVKRDEIRDNLNWMSVFRPRVLKWNSDWDRREPHSLVQPMKIKNEIDQNKYNKKLESHKAKATRHLILIRHGQYNLRGSTDEERILTDLGRRQAELTGKRLAELAIPFSLIIRSTMSRAQETSKIIEKCLPEIPVEDDVLLVEGAPILPDPPTNHWKSPKIFYTDGPRIEAAFRKYFYRASPQQEKDSYTLLVCHANVIRYFVCRALQFPPQAWLRFSLKNASITWVSIHSNGRVTLRCFGDSGHMPPETITTQ